MIDPHIHIISSPLDPHLINHFSIINRAVRQTITNPSMEVYRTILFSFLYLFPIFTISTATDTLNISQSITDNQPLVSAGGVFELGFFTPGNSTNRYIGIWYKKLINPTKQVVWVANREDPIVTFSSSAVLTVRNPGILVLLDHNETIIWSSNQSRSAANPVAQLLDSGNLVVRDESDDDPENYLWQSFDYPCDTLLPGMKHGKNLVTGLDRYLSSWKSPDDPARGNFAYRIESYGYPQLVMRKGSAVYFRGGPWNGIRFSGTPYLKPNSLYTYEFVLNEREYYYKYQLINTSVVTMLGLTYQGIYQRFIWIEKTQAWNVYLSGQTEPCDTYALCGPFGICNIGNSPGCACLKGYEPKFQKEWSGGNQTSGCVRRKALDCRGGDKFMKYSGVKLPNTRNSWFNVSMSLEECRIVCLKNCSCTAYATLDVLKGSGCLLWAGDLIDIRVFEENGQEIYVRVASSEIGGSNGKKRVIIIVSLVLLAGILLGLGLALCIRKKKKQQPSRQGKYQHNPERSYTSESQDDLELPLFDLASVAKATNNFSINNKIGEGGFGPVYKGKLQGGQEIAVKRLSIDSKQGIDEFKNEVLCIAKLQHRNLVKLLGCCLEEKMLIYEYMPNKSLDFFIFDQTQRKLLNWEKRINIINGIARGLLYLHQDSRLRIIHRDLKASNILLDYELNAKISDFGMAKSFGGNETEANTTRVVGTYGYMSPEYAIDGLFSVKSDVFSFGVLVLEIISGHKNRGFHHSDHDLNLIGHAWVLYLEGRPLELIDETMGDSCNLSEAIRLIHVGLLCVQQHPEDRPTMSAAVLMLGSDSELPPPKQPGFFTDRNPHEDGYSSGKQDTRSVNEMSITLLTAR